MSLLRRLKERIRTNGAVLNESAFPELSFCDEPKARAELWNAAYRPFGTRSQWGWYWTSVVIGALAGLLVQHLVLPAISPFIRVIPHFIVGAVLAGLIALMIVAALLQLLRSRIRRSLRRELRARGFRPCLHCGYDLRGTLGALCPECGQRDLGPPPGTPANEPAAAAVERDAPASGAEPGGDAPRHHTQP